MADIAVDRGNQLNRYRFPQADDPLTAQRPGSGKEGSAVGEEVGEAKTDRLDLLTKGIAIEQGGPRRCDRRGCQQADKEVGAGYRWIASLMLETKKMLKSSVEQWMTAVFSRTDEYVETNGSCASHEVVDGSSAGGWCVGGFRSAIALS